MADTARHNYSSLLCSADWSVGVGQCDGNGLSLTGFLNKAEKFQRVDMFLQNFPRMHPIAAFPALTQLFLIRQEIQVEIRLA